jgi:hypothetical protein
VRALHVIRVDFATRETRQPERALNYLAPTAGAEQTARRFSFRSLAQCLKGPTHIYVCMYVLCIDQPHSLFKPLGAEKRFTYRPGSEK